MNIALARRIAAVILALVQFETILRRAASRMENAEKIYGSIYRLVEQSNTLSGITKLDELLSHYRSTDTERYRRFHRELVQLRGAFNRISLEHGSHILDRANFRREMARIEGWILSLADELALILGIQDANSIKETGRKPARRTVFISYRRQDSADVTGRIYDRLRLRFGAECVYKDVDSIPYGVDFSAHINDALLTCSAAVIVIGPDWISAQNNDRRRRIDSELDLVRIEGMSRSLLTLRSGRCRD